MDPPTPTPSLNLAAIELSTNQHDPATEQQEQPNTMVEKSLVVQCQLVSARLDAFTNAVIEAQICSLIPC